MGKGLGFFYCQTPIALWVIVKCRASVCNAIASALYKMLIVNFSWEKTAYCCSKGFCLYFSNVQLSRIFKHVGISMCNIHLGATKLLYFLSWEMEKMLLGTWFACPISLQKRPWHFFSLTFPYSCGVPPLLWFLIRILLDTKYII